MLSKQSNKQTVWSLMNRLSALVKLGKIKVETPLIFALDDEGNYDYVKNSSQIMLFNRTDWSAISIDDYIENNHDQLHESYKERLRDTERYNGDLSEVDDGWDMFVIDEMMNDPELVFTCCIN